MFSQKKAVLMFQEMGTPKKLFIFQEVTFQARKMKKKISPKMFLVFYEMKLFSSKLKKLLVFLEPLRVFHHHRFSLLFSGVFIADCICSLHHCFFWCFYFTTDFTIVFSSVFILPTFFTVTVFLSGTSFCVAVSRVLRI